MANTKIIHETIGMNIKRRRKERGWTQQDLANKLGVERSVLAKYESGKIKNIPSDNIEKLEELFHLKHDELAVKAAIAIPDTSALLRNKRLISLLLSDYEKVVIPDVVFDELSKYKNMKINYNSKPDDKKKKRMASQIISNLDEYLYEYKDKGNIEKKETTEYTVPLDSGVSRNDKLIIELAKDLKAKTNRIIHIIHVDKDFRGLSGNTIEALYLDEYMSNRDKTESNIQDIMDFDLVFDHLERYEVAIEKMNVNAYLPDGMTLLISCIRCNDPEKVEQRDGRFIPAPMMIRKMKFLLEHHADPNKTDANQYCHTPLEHCLEIYSSKNDRYALTDGDKFKAFCTLLDYGADYNKCSVDELQIRHKRLSNINEGNTPLMIACWHGNRKAVNKLLQYEDLSINQQDCNGYTALMKCAVKRLDQINNHKPYNWYEDLYNLLIEHGADTKIRDRNNKTAVDWWEEGNIALSKGDDNDDD